MLKKFYSIWIVIKFWKCSVFAQFPRLPKFVHNLIHSILYKRWSLSSLLVTVLSFVSSTKNVTNTTKNWTCYHFSTIIRRISSPEIQINETRSPIITKIIYHKKLIYLALRPCEINLNNGVEIINTTAP